jgi:hypothetical protein
MSTQSPKKSPPVSPEEMREWVAASRAQQGLPPTIQDPGILERCAAAFRVMALPADESTVSTPRKRRRKPSTTDQEGTAA